MLSKRDTGGNIFWNISLFKAIFDVILKYKKLWNLTKIKYSTREIECLILRAGSKNKITLYLNSKLNCKYSSNSFSSVSVKLRGYYLNSIVCIIDFYYCSLLFCKLFKTTTILKSNLIPSTAWLSRNSQFFMEISLLK